jgi:cytochrome d ubiquinol oxidase subunit II
VNRENGVIQSIGAPAYVPPLTQPNIAERWFSLPNLFWFLPVPVLVVLAMLGLLRTLRSGAQAAPFLLTLALIFLSYSGLGISLWPNIIPPGVSIWDAAGPDQSLGFTLVGTLFIVPFILMYTAWAYWVFRGKVRRGEGYH